MQSETLIEKAEAENLAREEEEEPAWVESARKVLEDSDQEKQATTDYFVTEIERLKRQLKEAQEWRPRPQHEVVELNIALQRRNNKLLEDQNKLFAILVETLEESLDPNSFTTMRTHGR